MRATLRARFLAPANKYGAKRTEIAALPGRVFASKREAERAQELLILERAGKIGGIQYQPAFDLEVNGVKIGRYVADFRYLVLDGRGGWDYDVVEDVKGVRTPVFKLKKKLMLACHGIVVEEVA